MPKREAKREELTEEELAAQEAEEVPDREEMMLVPIPGDDLGGPIHTLPVEPPDEA